jgi:hypothetical protein
MNTTCRSWEPAGFLGLLKPFSLGADFTPALCVSGSTHTWAIGSSLSTLCPAALSTQVESDRKGEMEGISPGAQWTPGRASLGKIC